MKPVDRGPARLSGTVSFLMAGATVLATGLYSWPALSAGLLGMALLLLGVVRTHRSAVTVGSSGLFVGVLVAGVQGAPEAAVLVSMTATVLAWDTGRTSISLGRQLGSDAPTARLELVHLAASGGIGGLTIGAGYVIYENATSGQPMAALILLVVATVILLTAVLPDNGDSREVS